MTLDDKADILAGVVPPPFQPVESEPQPDFARFITTPPYEKYPAGEVPPIDIRKGVQQIAENINKNLSNIFSPKVLIQGRARDRSDYTLTPSANKEDSMTAGDLTPLGRGEVPEDVLSARRWTFSTEYPATRTAQRVVGDILPDAARLFVKRNKDYGDGANELGLKGQYADINRKVKKLKRILWDGIEPTGESAEEIALDLIGHLGLTIDMIRESNKEDKE